MGSIGFTAQARVLVLAPHPDDETLAAGVLLQAAQEAGAAVQVVFATDGDNNPWPQRWLERRWTIDAAARARWAACRRRESALALRRLGLDPLRDCVRLGWPDQGVTARLMDGSGTGPLAAALAAFRPTHVVVPSRADTHPDHNALAVLAELALLHARLSPLRLAYTVHGPSPERPVLAPADTARLRRKLAALEAYPSQTTLSGGRLRKAASRPEAFVWAAEVAAPRARGPAFHLPSPARHLRGHELLLVFAGAEAVHRFRIPLPTQGREGMQVEVRDRLGAAVSVDRCAGGWRFGLPAGMRGRVRAVFAKVHRSGARVLIFDHAGWADTADLLSHQPEALDRAAAPA